MKLSKKVLASLIGATLFITGPLSVVNPAKTFASERNMMNNTQVKIANSLITENSNKFSLEVSDAIIDVDINYTDNGVRVETITNGTEENIFIYNKDTNIAMMNNRVINIEFNEYIEPELIYNSDEFLNSGFSTFASPDDTPVYVVTRDMAFSDVVGTIGAIVGVIAGVIAIANLAGIAIPAILIQAKVADWLSVIGMGLTFASMPLNGKFTFKLYRTKDMFDTGYGGVSKQYKYRYQDLRTEGKLGNLPMNIQLVDKGNWWWQSKPY